MAFASLTNKKLQTGVFAFLGIKLLGNLIADDFLYCFGIGVFFGVFGSGPKLSSENQMKLLPMCSNGITCDTIENRVVGK